MAKKIWKATADIPQNTQFMMGYPLQYMFEDWPKVGFGDFLIEYFTYFKGDFSQMVYPAKEFDAQAEYLSAKMIARPKWSLDILEKVEIYSSDLFKLMKQIPKIPLAKLSAKQLISLMKKIGKVHRLQHGLAPALTWLADSEKERVTKALLKMVDQKLKSSGLKMSLSEVFTIITTPTREGLLEKEEKDFLSIGALMVKKEKLKKLFIQSDLEELSENLMTAAKPVAPKILKHYQAYAPMTYQYKGPAFPLIDYIGRWQAFLREGKSPSKALLEIKNKREHLAREQKRLLKKLVFSARESDLIKMAQEMMFIKEFRKNALYHAMYYYELIFKEIARRYGLSVSQIQALKPWEIMTLLKKGRIDLDEVNNRQKLSIDYWYKKNGKAYNIIYTGQAAEKFLKNIVWQKADLKVKELQGTCAYPGKVVGIVKVINIPAEMGKMEKGDIMVAHNTNPNLVPAMKKAAALVGAAGGLTCHTAIVAREMKIPCLVGAADCDRIFKDGDKVEVNATLGTVRKL